ncbi:MAG: hypothetical protein AVDCRST_MAG57-915 [uncultured Blastococcus sp.]|uniref:Camelysin metallo-endopeptidase n=1 Tax=uncultured Blastococcus sp. TaxID=217144 RepID=A0A6J4HNQ2_9ACTN|nr:MAG: hypothetical protein AVDCRST_MAG57-915 [uncultured Blastococcus sp.]
MVGAIAAVGAAAAVAGLGTFGEFTESTAPVGTTVGTGVVSIALSQAGDSGSVPFAGGQMLAGDSRTHLVDLVNDGDTALGSVTLTSWASASSILDSDRTNGLQLSVESCSVAWSADGSCSGTERGFYTGPVLVTDRALTGATSLAPGAVDRLRLTVTLPATASGDAFESASSALNFVVTGTQRTGTAR